MVERVYGKLSPEDPGRALERVPALAANTALNLYGAPSKIDDSVESVDSPNRDIPPEIWRAPPDSNGRPADSKFYDLAQDVATLGPHVGQLRANAERYLKAVASRSRLASRYGEELARQVLELEVVKLAQEVLGGDMTYSRATRLAQAILTGAKGREIAEGRVRATRPSVRVGRRG